MLVFLGGFLRPPSLCSVPQAEQGWPPDLCSHIVLSIQPDHYYTGKIVAFSSPSIPGLHRVERLIFPCLARPDLGFSIRADFGCTPACLEILGGEVWMDIRQSIPSVIIHPKDMKCHVDRAGPLVNLGLAPLPPSSTTTHPPPPTTTRFLWNPAVDLHTSSWLQ